MTLAQIERRLTMLEKAVEDLRAEVKRPPHREGAGGETMPVDSRTIRSSRRSSVLGGSIASRFGRAASGAPENTLNIG